MAIYDTMQYIKSEVVTICVGLAASMGAFFAECGCEGQATGAAAFANYDSPAFGWGGPLAGDRY